ncbi:hypothetical protein M9458_016889, partial [Cirrhinus mrigala]
APPPFSSALRASLLTSGLVLYPRAPAVAPPRAFWTSMSGLWRLVLSLALLAFPGPASEHDASRSPFSQQTRHRAHRHQPDALPDEGKPR